MSDTETLHGGSGKRQPRRGDRAHGSQDGRGSRGTCRTAAHGLNGGHNHVAPRLFREPACFASFSPTSCWCFWGTYEPTFSNNEVSHKNPDARLHLKRWAPLVPLLSQGRCRGRVEATPSHSICPPVSHSPHHALSPLVIEAECQPAFLLARGCPSHCGTETLLYSYTYSVTKKKDKKRIKKKR